MKNLIYIASIFCTIAILSSCKKDHMGDCFVSTGLISKETRDLAVFDSIRIGRRMELVLVEDTVNYVVLEAGRNLLDNITTTLENGLLSIENTNKCNWIRSYKYPVTIEVHFSNLRHIFIEGSTNVESKDTIHQNELTFELRDCAGDLNLLVNNQKLNIIQHTGASDIEVKGRTEDLSIYMASLATGDYDELLAKTVYVQTLSSGFCRVYATDTFYFVVDGNGSIYYKGSGVVTHVERNGGGGIAPIL
jgi:hypothetical protein